MIASMFDMAKVVNRAYKYRFYPTLEQAAELSRTFGCVRKVWNLALEARTTAWHQRHERLTYLQSDPEPVEAEFLGQTRAGEHLPEPLLGRFLLARPRVGGVHDQRDGDEPHEAARVVVVSPGRRSGVRPRWSRSVVPV